MTWVPEFYRVPIAAPLMCYRAGGPARTAKYGNHRPAYRGPKQTESPKKERTKDRHTAPELTYGNATRCTALEDPLVDLRRERGRREV